MNNNQIIPGFHGTREALRAFPSEIREVWFMEDKKGPRIDELIQLAKKNSIPFHFKKSMDFDQILFGINHQGICAVAAGFTYSSVEEISISCCFPIY